MAPLLFWSVEDERYIGDGSASTDGYGCGDYGTASMSGTGNGYGTSEDILYDDGSHDDRHSDNGSGSSVSAFGYGFGTGDDSYGIGIIDGAGCGSGIVTTADLGAWARQIGIDAPFNE